MADRNIGFKVNEDFYKRIKVKIAQDGITLKEYVIKLIEKDLEAEPHRNPSATTGQALS